MNEIECPSVSDICDEFGEVVRDVSIETDYADLPVTDEDRLAWRLQWENRYSRTPAETFV